MILYDTVDVSAPRITKDGYLVADVKVARTGIQLYSAAELGMDGEKSRAIRVYRPPEEVFSADAMASYAHRPITVDHPSEMVDAGNWKRFSRGQTGDEVVRDGEFVRVPIMLMDGQAIADWEAGRRELSMGYTMDLVVADGVTPSGEQYDAVQKNLRMNHLALVSHARGGSNLRLGDFKPEDSSMSEVKLTTITVDGLSVETTDAGAQAISKLKTELEGARKATVDAESEHKSQMKAKDAELAAKDAELEAAQKKVLSDKDLDQKVNDRADLIATAKSIADKDYTGKSADEIRSAAVSAKLGQDAIVGKSVDYIAARFDILAEDASQDPVRNVLRSGPTIVAGDAVDKAHAGMVSNLQNAWKGEEAQ